MSYTNAQDLLKAAESAHSDFVRRLSKQEPGLEGSCEATRASQLSDKHRRIARTLNELLKDSGVDSEAGEPSTWLQYDLSFESDAFEAEAGPFQSSDEAVAAAIEMANYFARLFELAERQVSAPTEKAVLSDLAKLEKEIGKEASWAQQQNADIVGSQERQ